MSPDTLSGTPVGSGLFGYNPVSTLISETGIPATVSTTHARVYVDLSGNHNTGLAIANLDPTSAAITVKAFQTDGVTAAGRSQGALPLAGNGHDARFADEFIAGLPAGFKGVLDISSPTPFAAITLRSLMNERNEFLMTTFPVVEAEAAAPSPVVFPQIADGGGYTTQFILISPSAEVGIILSLRTENGSPWAIAE